MQRAQIAAVLDLEIRALCLFNRQAPGDRHKSVQLRIEVANPVEIGERELL